MIINSQSSLQVGWSGTAADDDTDRSDDDDNGVKPDLPLEIFFSFGNCLKKGGGPARCRQHHDGDNDNEVDSRHQHPFPQNKEL